MVDVARGSRLNVSYAMEDSWASLPTIYTAYNLRLTDMGVNLTKDSFQSNELRADRHIADLRHGMRSVSGDIPVELSYQSFDDMIESAMYNEWETDNTIVTGTTEKSFTLQKHFSDIGQYHVFSGCIVNTWSVSVQPNAIVTSTFNIMGEDMTTSTSPTLAGATAKSAYSPMDSFTGALSEGGSAISIITGIDFSIANNIATLPVIGSKYTAGLVDGRATITGTVNAYFANSILLAKFLNETESSLQFSVSDGTRSMQFYMPRIKYSGGDVPTSGEGPITMSMPFQALYDSVTGYSLRITKVPS
jgi:hypothetical protein